MLLPEFDEFLEVYIAATKAEQEEALFPETHIVQGNFRLDDKESVTRYIQAALDESARASNALFFRRLRAYHSWLQVQLEELLTPNGGNPNSDSD